MSEEKLNTEDIFVRKIKLREDSHYYEGTDDVKISFSLPSEVMTI